MPIPHGFRDLKVYQLAYQLAMEIGISSMLDMSEMVKRYNIKKGK